VAVLACNSVFMIEALVSVARTGAEIILLNTFLAPAQIVDLLHRERPRALLADADLLSTLPALDGIATIVMRPGADTAGSVTLDDLARRAGPVPPPPTEKSRMVILTSGTTGAPKGARRGAPKGLGPAASMLSRIPLRPKERILIAPPLFHTWGLGALQLAPAINSTVVLRRQSDPATMLTALAEHRCTGWIVVPVMLQRLLELPADQRDRYDLSALRVVACSGAALSGDLTTRFQDTFGDVLYNVYGSTEVSWATIATPGDLRTSPGTAGRPPLGTRLAVLDDDGSPVPSGRSGRIFVGNELTFDGYTNGTDKERVGGLVATGDRGVVDEHGLLTVLGRDDDMIITGGENLYPGEVEELLAADVRVRDVAVTGVPDREMGQRLAAYIVLRDGAHWTADEVRDHVRSRLARFSVPRDVVFLDDLPRTATGKVVRRLLPHPLQPAEDPE
jgi:acyl-CoA synthetase (AMP-forming)/AMP-acid ligase II